jgi:hypothetical protein
MPQVSVGDVQVRHGIGIDEVMMVGPGVKEAQQDRH